MERSGGEDPKLSEVKAVLQRLQRISANQEGKTLDPLSVPPRASGARRTGLLVSLGLAFVAALAVGAVALTDLNQLIWPAGGKGAQPASPPRSGQTDIPRVKDASLEPPASKPSSAQRPALEAAVGQLSAGRVRAARRQLLGLVSEDTAEVAWALARSYDPNFLATIPGADAEPDIAEATRWYRTWHAAAVKQGLVTHNVSLERLIESMR